MDDVCLDRFGEWEEREGGEGGNTENDRRPDGGEMKSSIIPFNVYVPCFRRRPEDPLDPCSSPGTETGVSRAKSGLDLCLRS